MSSSKSKSSSNSSSSTENIDARAGAEAGSIAIGGGGSVSIVDEFPEEIGAFANRILETLEKVTGDVSKSAQAGAAASIASVQSVAERSQSTGLIFQDIIKQVQPVALIAAAGVVGLALLRKGK